MSKHIGEFMRYNKDYIINAWDKINQWNIVFGEYYRSKIALNEKRMKNATGNTKDANLTEAMAW